MASYKGNLLNHFKIVKKWADRAGADAILDVSSFRLLIRRNDQQAVLYPQFMNVEDRRRQYSPELTDASRRFIGWLPYSVRRWAIASDKIEFKRYAERAGMRTPEYCLDDDPAIRDVIVKRRSSSFSVGIRGPFRHAGEAPLDASQSEYYERFIDGRIGKIWFYENFPICMEIERMPSVTGDGMLSARDLIQVKLRAKGATGFDMERAETLRRFCGDSLERVPARDETVVVDFRYGSALAVREPGQNINLKKAMPEVWSDELRAIGEACWRGIPAEIQEGTIYTVDVVVDPEERIWALEMNSNPFVHPFLYGHLLSNLVKRDAAERVRH
ncbi:hypothetical protein ACN22W_30000 [Burkholderia theae]|uniref:hypothetical protein n=1 Tax=Burkholderia theae TaxID=3143496 RepID=UPI003AFAD5A2